MMCCYEGWVGHCLLLCFSICLWGNDDVLLWRLGWPLSVALFFYLSLRKWWCVAMKVGLAIVCCFVFLFVFEEMMMCCYEGWVGHCLLLCFSICLWGNDDVLLWRLGWPLSLALFFYLSLRKWWCVAMKVGLAIVCCFVFLFVFEEMMMCCYEGWVGHCLLLCFSICLWGNDDVLLWRLGWPLSVALFFYLSLRKWWCVAMKVGLAIVCCFVFLFVFEEMMMCCYEGWVGHCLLLCFSICLWGNDDVLLWRLGWPLPVALFFYLSLRKWWCVAMKVGLAIVCCFVFLFVFEEMMMCCYEGWVGHCLLLCFSICLWGNDDVLLWRLGWPLSVALFFYLSLRKWWCVAMKVGLAIVCCFVFLFVFEEMMMCCYEGWVGHCLLLCFSICLWGNDDVLLWRLGWPLPVALFFYLSLRKWWCVAMKVGLAIVCCFVFLFVFEEMMMCCYEGWVGHCLLLCFSICLWGNDDVLLWRLGWPLSVALFFYLSLRKWWCVAMKVGLAIVCCFVFLFVFEEMMICCYEGWVGHCLLLCFSICLWGNDDVLLWRLGWPLSVALFFYLSLRKWWCVAMKVGLAIACCFVFLFVFEEMMMCCYEGWVGHCLLLCFSICLWGNDDVLLWRLGWPLSVALFFYLSLRKWWCVAMKVGLAIVCCFVFLFVFEEMMMCCYEGWVGHCLLLCFSICLWGNDDVLLWRLGWPLSVALFFYLSLRKWWCVAMKVGLAIVCCFVFLFVFEEMMMCCYEGWVGHCLLLCFSICLWGNDDVLLWRLGWPLSVALFFYLSLRKWWCVAMKVGLAIVCCFVFLFVFEEMMMCCYEGWVGHCLLLCFSICLWGNDDVLLWRLGWPLSVALFFYLSLRKWWCVAMKVGLAIVCCFVFLFVFEEMMMCCYEGWVGHCLLLCFSICLWGNDDVLLWRLGWPLSVALFFYLSLRKWWCVAMKVGLAIVCCFVFLFVFEEMMMCCYEGWVGHCLLLCFSICLWGNDDVLLWRLGWPLSVALFFYLSLRKWWCVAMKVGLAIVCCFVFLFVFEEMMMCCYEGWVGHCLLLCFSICLWGNDDVLLWRLGWPLSVALFFYLSLRKWWCVAMKVGLAIVCCFVFLFVFEEMMMCCYEGWVGHCLLLCFSICLWGNDDVLLWRLGWPLPVALFFYLSLRKWWCVAMKVGLAIVCCFVFLFVFEEMMMCCYEGWVGHCLLLCFSICLWGNDDVLLWRLGWPLSVALFFYLSLRKWWCIAMKVGLAIVCCFVFLFVFEEMMMCCYEGWVGHCLLLCFSICLWGNDDVLLWRLGWPLPVALFFYLSLRKWWCVAMKVGLAIVCCFVFLFVFEEMMMCCYEGWVGHCLLLCFSICLWGNDDVLLWRLG